MKPEMRQRLADEYNEQVTRIKELESELAIAIRGHEQDTERHVEEIRLLRQELAELKLVASGKLTTVHEGHEIEKLHRELTALKDRLLIEEQYRITTEPAYMKRECVLEEELAALKSRLAEQLHKQDTEREQAAVVIDTLEKEIAAARTLRCDKCSRWIDTEYYSECPACKNVELKTKLDDANMAADHNADEWVIVTRKMEKALAIIDEPSEYSSHSVIERNVEASRKLERIKHLFTGGET
jgi:hypothetical protein